MSNIIKKRRKELHIKQKDLASRCNVKQSHISKLENDKIIPSTKLIVALAKALDLCPSEIFKYYVCKKCYFLNVCEKD